jgi:tetratricopeptide (TPR) repeat protein
MSFDTELGRLREVFDELADQGLMRLVLINGPKGGGRTQLLHRFLDDFDELDDITVIHRHSFLDGNYKDRGLTADIAQLQQPEENSSLGEGILPMLDADGGPASGTAGSMTDGEAAFFGDLHGKRETMLSKTGRLFRERAAEKPVVWALERLERLDAFTLAFLNWFFQDLRSRPAPIFIVATVSRPDLVDRAGLLRYTQAILGAAEPTVRRLFVAESPSSQSAVQPEVEDISDTLTGKRTGVPDEIAGADDREPGGRETLQVDQEAVEDEIDLQSLFDETLGLLAQLGDEVSVETWEEVRDQLLDIDEPENIEFILERAEQFGIVEREEGVLSFGSPSFAERLRDRIDEVGAFDADTRRALAEALADLPSEASREEIDLAVHHLIQADDLSAGIELLNRAGNAAFSILDLDAAREYYLQLQRLFEQTDDERLADVREDVEADPSRIWLRIGEIHGALDEHGAAEDALERAADRAESRFPQIRGRSLKRMADIQFAQERYTEAEVCYARAREALAAAGEEASAVASASLVGDSMLQQGEFEEAYQTLNEILDDAESLHLPLVLARIQLRIGRACLRLGHFDEAFRHLADASESFDALDQPDEAMEARMVFGETAFAGRDFALARDNFEQSRDHARRVRRFDEHFPTLGLSRSLAALEEYDRAADAVDDHQAPELRARTPVREALWSMHRADLFFVHEASPAAEARYDEMQEKARSVGRTDLVLSALLRKAVLHFQDVEYDRSAEVFEEAASLAREYGDHQRYIVARASAVYLEAASREFPAQNGRLAEQLDKAVGNALTWATAVCTQYIADVRAANGAWEAAEELLQRSRRKASESGQLGMLGPIGHRLARVRAIRDGREPPTLGGALIGGPLPPEIRMLRPDAIYEP